MPGQVGITRRGPEGRKEGRREGRKEGRKEGRTGTGEETGEETVTEPEGSALGAGGEGEPAGDAEDAGAEGFVVEGLWSIGDFIGIQGDAGGEYH